MRAQQTTIVDLDMLFVGEVPTGEVVVTYIDPTYPGGLISVHGKARQTMKKTDIDAILNKDR